MPSSLSCAATLFVTAGNSPFQRQFLSKQQQYYPESVIVNNASQQGMAMTGFVAPDQQGVHDLNKLKQSAFCTSMQIGCALPDVCRQADTIVAVGETAARATIQDCTAPLLLIMVRRQQLNEYFNRPQRAAMSAIYLEVDPVLNLRLLKTIIPKARAVGVIVSAQSELWMPALREEAQRLDVKLQEVEAASDEDAVRQLRVPIDYLDAVLLLPETTVVNEWSLKPILLMATRNYVPVFGGINEKYVNAGVLAAVVPDWDRLHDQITRFTDALSHGKNPPPAYPAAIHIVTNPTVARTLSIDLPSVDPKLLAPSE